MTNKPLLLDEPKETPHYQRFVAFAVLLPTEKGKRQYHRVVITGTHNDLEKDLGEILPKQARWLLSHSDSQEIKARTKRRVETTTPNRQNYYAFCSCRADDCEHLKDAIDHFFLIQDFAENSGQIIKDMRDNRILLTEYSEKIEETNNALATLATDLSRLENERTELSARLQKVKEEDDQLAYGLIKELDAKNKEFEQLQAKEETVLTEKKTLQDEKQEIECRNQSLQANIETLSNEMRNLAARKLTAPPAALPSAVTGVVGRHFALEPSDLEPDAKLAPDVFSDHHKAANAEMTAHKLSAIDFVRYVGVSYRHSTKHNKVTVLPSPQELEMVITDGDSGNIFKITTTAKSKAQQLLAAYLLAEQFDARVESR